MRITVRVKPAGSTTRVAGSYGDHALVVRTTAPAVDGRANEAAVKAVADAFGIPASRVTIVQGHTARTKVLELDIDAAEGSARLARLLAQE